MNSPKIEDALKAYMLEDIACIDEEILGLSPSYSQRFEEAAEILGQNKINVMVVHEKADEIYRNAKKAISYFKLDEFPIKDAAQKLVQSYVRSEVDGAVDRMTEKLESRNKILGIIISA
jgi:hypothetical protein